MKNKSIIITVLIALTVLFAITSCELVPISVEQRISLFLADLNQDPRPDSIRYNFSSSCLDYGTIDGDYFLGDFPLTAILYSVSIPDYGADPVAGTISGTGGTFGTDVPIEFTMVKESSDWFILKLVLDTATIVE